eukprot:8678959-Pyramimonas_sp.AAC.1
MGVPACVPHTPVGTPLARFAAPHGGPADSPSGRARTRPAHPYFGTPLTEFVAPQGAPPKVPVGVPACTSHTHFCPPTLRGPMGGSAEGPSGCARMRTAHPFRHTPRMFRGPIRSSTEGPSGCARMRPPPPMSAYPSHA